MSLNHYNKVKVVGKGSYGEVWLVKHRKDKKQYVLKKLELKTASKRERKAAEQEAKLLSRLKHPNIVSYKDSFQDETGFLFIAMGYCEGGDLYTRLKEQKNRALEERQVVEWFVQIAMALQYMHDRNILHRDLKTQNIFLTKSKIIKVGDLGIARVLDSSCDMATTLIGTPYYMSPELFSNKPYNHKSDVWALGCCVYEMATLKHAFNAKDMNSLVYKILRGKMPNMPKTYSAALVQLIKAMLNQNPEKRPSVNRILRDPYIKKNIAVFLEGTKKSRPSSSGSSRSSASHSARKARGGEDVPDSARSSGNNPGIKAHDKSRAPSISDLEPLQVGPDLEPIKEEEDSAPSPQKPAIQRIRRDSSGSNGGGKSRSKVSSKQSGGERLTPAFTLSERSPKMKRRQANDKDSRSRSNSSSRSPGPGSSNSQRGLPPRPQSGHKRSGSDPVFLPERGSSPTVSRRQIGSDKTPVDSPAGSGDLSTNSNSQESVKSSEPSSARKSRVLKKKKKRPSDPQAEPEPIVISVDSVQDNMEAKSSARSTKSSRRSSEGSLTGGGAASSRGSRDVDPEFGIVRDSNTRPVLIKKVESEPIISNGARSERLKSSGKEMDRSFPHPSSSGSEPRPSSSGQQRGGVERGVAERESGYGSSSSSLTSQIKDEEGRPMSARARRREKKELETPRSSRSIDLDKNRRSYDVSSSHKKAGGGSAGLGYKSEDFSSRSHRKHSSGSGGDLDSTDGFEREPEQKDRRKSAETSSSDDAEEDREQKRNDKEMNNFISLLDTTLKLAPKEEEDTAATSTPAFYNLLPSNCPINGATYVKGPAPGRGMGRLPEVPVIEVEEDTLTEEKVSQDEQAPEYSYPTGTGHLAIPAGRTMTTTGRLWERITVLRKDCIRGLGVEKLKKAYDILDNIEGDEMEPRLIALLGRDDFDFYAGKIWQLKFCEEAAFGLV